MCIKKIHTTVYYMKYFGYIKKKISVICNQYIYKYIDLTVETKRALCDILLLNMYIYICI